MIQFPMLTFATPIGEQNFCIRAGQAEITTMQVSRKVDTYKVSLFRSTTKINKAVLITV